MKITHFLFAVALLALTACSTMNRTHHGSAKTPPETVLVTYYVQTGKEAEFQEVLSRAWQIYRTEHLVYAAPHIVVRDTEAGDKVRFVELFTWVSHEASEHAPDSVKTIWKEEHSLCEVRGGHGGIEGGEIEILTGRWPGNARWP